MIGTGAALVRDTVIPAKYGTKADKEYALFTKESVEVPRMGPGESYMGVFGKVCTARRLLVKRPLLQAGGSYLRGLADDVMLRHYRACNTCRSFGDMVCVTAPATVICIHK